MLMFSLRQQLSGEVCFYFGSHQEMVEFVKATSNVNWDAYKESKLREGGQNDKEWESFVNESVEVMNTHGAKAPLVSEIR